MNVLFVAGEMAPLAKVGGVGDVASALPRALRGAAIDVRVALPLYASVDREAAAAQHLGPLPDGVELWCGRAGGTPVYLYENDPSFGRDQIYGYDDEVERFLLFCRAMAASAEALEWRPDVIHLNDWMTGFVGTCIANAKSHAWSNVPRVFTVHNLGYRGDFDKRFARAHGLPSRALHAPPGISRHVPYSGLAQGLLHSDLITIVSPTYAREVLTPEHGGALAPLLNARRDRLTGILNGIDTEEFNPATDRHLPKTFDAESLDGRRDNKRALQKRAGLPIEDVPLIGMVTRLFEQKGSDLAAPAIDDLLQRDVPLQFVVLGSGDPLYEAQLADLAERWPAHVSMRFAFDAPYGQLIYGGSDCFLMPSRYEPCGLGQMIAMRYGAIPIVRRTGGLADSVDQYDARAQSGTGFLFDEPSAKGTAAAIEDATEAFRDKLAWRALQRRAMARDFSWERAAKDYIAVYERAQSIEREVTT